MSNFDLRKFLAEQKTAKVNNVKEETIKEFDAGVVAVGAPIVMSVVAAGIAKLGFDKIMQAIARIDKDKFNKFVQKYASDFEEGHHKDMEEAHDEMEEALNEGHDKDMEEAHDEMEEGEMHEDIGKVVDFIMQNADKSIDWIKKNIKVGSMHQAMSSEAHDEMEEAHDEMEEAHDDMEEGHKDMEEKKDHMEEAHKDMEEAHDDMEEVAGTALAGMAAIIGSTAAAAKALDFIKKKYPDAVDKFVKSVDAGQKASYKRMEEEVEEGDSKEMEEALNEEKFKSTIKDILNS